MSEQKVVEKDEGFEAFRNGLSSGSYMTKGKLYVINYSKKPKQIVRRGEWNKGVFTPNENGTGKSVQFEVETIDVASGVPSNVIITEKVYRDVLAQHDAFVALQKTYSKLSLFPYVKV